MSAVRAFPVRVRAFAGEGPESYFRRLCEANAVTERDAWLVLRHQDPALWYEVGCPLGARYVAALGGLPDDFFTSVIGLAGAAGGESKGITPRAMRRESSPPVPLCRRCARGEVVLALAPSGPICLRHRRWVAHDIDTRQLPRHNAAQRCLNGTLRGRGIGYRSSAIAATREALRRVKGERLPGRKEAVVPLEVEMSEFPDVVRLTALLTSDAMVRLLLNDELGTATRGIAIAYVAHVVLAGHGAADAIAAIRTAGREMSLGRGIPVIGPYTRVADLPEFASAITGSNDGIRTRLLRFLQTSEYGRLHTPARRHASDRDAARVR